MKGIRAKLLTHSFLQQREPAVNRAMLRIAEGFSSVCVYGRVVFLPGDKSLYQPKFFKPEHVILVDGHLLANYFVSQGCRALAYADPSRGHLRGHRAFCHG